nr:hypothetical protein [Streptomyces sp. PsTaAH-124]
MTGLRVTPTDSAMRVKDSSEASFRTAGRRGRKGWEGRKGAPPGPQARPHPPASGSEHRPRPASSPHFARGVDRTPAARHAPAPRGAADIQPLY